MSESYTLALSDKQLTALARKIAAHADPDRWRTKDDLATFYGCGARTVETWHAAGMPSKLIAGKVVFKVSATDKWLETNGHLRDERGKDPRRHVDNGGKLNQSNTDANGAALREQPAPGHEE